MKKQMITFTTILWAVGFLALTPFARALVPPPEGGYPNLHTALGDKALFNSTGGLANTAVGWYSQWGNTTGSFDTSLGAGALLYPPSEGDRGVGGGVSYNTAVGAGALLLNEPSDNTAVGAFALLNNIDGSDNSALGHQALFSHLTGAFNNAVGADALYSDESGSSNNAFGNSALSYNVVGINNTAAGDRALDLFNTGDNNIALGAGAGINQTTGSNNIYIGDHGVAGESNVIAIGRFLCSAMGYEGFPQTSTYIGGIYDSVVIDPMVYVGSDGHLGTLVSSRRYKEEIKPMGEASEGLFALKPVTFRYKQEIDPSHKLSFGLVAEEVAEVNPELVSRDKEGKPQTVRYEAVNAMLLNQFLKEHKKVQELESQLAHEEEQIEALTAGLRKVSAQLATGRVRVAAATGLELSKAATQTVLNNQ